MERCSRRSRFGESSQNEVTDGSVHFQVVKNCVRASFFIDSKRNPRGTDKKKRRTSLTKSYTFRKSVLWPVQKMKNCNLQIPLVNIPHYFYSQAYFERKVSHVIVSQNVLFGAMAFVFAMFGGFAPKFYGTFCRSR